jgi:endonuclease/exonuclease/phosphatase family metal-dependent hydrolase
MSRSGIPPHRSCRRLGFAWLVLVAACVPGPQPADSAPAVEASICPHAASSPSGSRTLPVYWSHDAANAELLEPWCAAVGAATVHQPDLGTPGDAAGTGGVDSLAVVSWNVHVGGGDIASFVEDLRAGRLTAGRPVRDFVLLLQESYRAGEDIPKHVPAGAIAPPGIYNEPESGARADIQEVAGLLELSAFYVPSMRNGPRREDRGNAVLSTLPLRQLTAVELPFEAQRRVAALATLEAETSDGVPWRLRVSSLHLDLWSRNEILASLGRGRLRQAAAVVDLLGYDAPVVLGGDLNTWSPREEVLSYLRQEFPETPPASRFRTHTTGRRLDHLFFRLPDCWEARYRRLDDRYGSDHYPLLGWVTFDACSADHDVSTATGDDRRGA